MTDRAPLRVGIVGCGLIGRKRAEALGNDQLVGCFDVVPDAAAALAGDHGGTTCNSVDQLLSLMPDVVVVATTHDQLAELSRRAIEAGCHVLVEKPAGIGVAQIDLLREASRRADRMVKVGFNHRFHPGIAQAITEARSGAYGDVLYLRARYGHGGRLGYEKEWRTDPARSGGGEIIDQGMHLLDLSYWLLGEVPVHSSMLKTQFWQAPVDDNAVLILTDSSGVGNTSPWALLHVSWTEWKNLFSMEITCETAKWAVDGLVRSYGSQVLTTYRMKPELGPPDTDRLTFSQEDTSWELEWSHFADAIAAGDGRPLLGDLESARYAWSCVEHAQHA